MSTTTTTISATTATATVAPTMRKQLGQILLANGRITREQLEHAIEEQKMRGHGQLLGEVLTELGYVKEDQVVEALAEAYGIPYAKLSPRLADARVVDMLPRDFCERHAVLPLFHVEGVVTVAFGEPTNVFLIEEIARMTSATVQVVAASASDILAMLRQHVPSANVFVIDDIIDNVGADTFELIETKTDDIASLEGMAGDSPIIKLVNYLIYSAVKEGASDIHIEPDEAQLRVRYRIDGVLHEKMSPPSKMQPAIASRIKIMASMDIAERRLPQDGGIHVMMENRPIDLRVSSLPNQFGEKVVIRVIDNSRVLVNLEKLGFSVEMLKEFREQISQPHGLVLVTGPTGSGKSTTLYAVLGELNTPEVNICTVEDPIEYNLRHINQFQVNERIGLRFPVVLRSLLRQDPDIIMVGEVRDDDTARTAVQAALTGHLVLTTLHTNDAPSAVTRLCNIGVEPYLLGASIVAVLAQRLVRKTCPHCRTEYEPPANILHTMEKAGFPVTHLSRGLGCQKCHKTGYLGRFGIYELLVPNEDAREAITNGANLQQLRELAKTSGMMTLRSDGLAKVKAGVTTIEEVFRVCAV